MKTAISVPDDLFREMERCSRRLQVSRSRLFADAAREYLAKRRDPSHATALWNQAIAEAGQPGAVGVRGRSKAALREMSALTADTIQRTRKTLRRERASRA